MYEVGDLSGALAVVTGANSGTGKEIARRLAGANAHVVMAVRSIERGNAAREEILSEFANAHLEVRLLDLANQASVTTFAETLLSEGVPLDILVNNAGVMAPPKRIVTVDGFELQFATNVLGPFALSVRLLPALLKAPAPRVSSMSSLTAIMGRVDFDNLQGERHYKPNRAYAQSKLADLMMAVHLSELSKQRGWSLVSNAAHPGFTRTNLLLAGASLGRAKQSRLRTWASTLTFLPSQDVRQGAEPLLYAATDPDARAGAYYGPREVFGLVGPTKVARPPRRALDASAAARLWDVAEQLTGVSIKA